MPLGAPRRRLTGPRTPAGRGGRAGRRPPAASPVDVTVAVIGAGQAGLSAAYHLRRAGLVAVGEPGWETAAGHLRRARRRPAGRRRVAAPVARAHHGRRARRPRPARACRCWSRTSPSPPRSPCRTTSRSTRRRSSSACSGPCAWSGSSPTATGCWCGRAASSGPTRRSSWRARGLINASGTWQKPFWPAYPGRGGFRGRQLHSHDFQLPEDLADGHVVVIGGGTSAVQLLAPAGARDDDHLGHAPTAAVARRGVHPRGRPRRRRARSTSAPAPACRRRASSA